MRTKNLEMEKELKKLDDNLLNYYSEIEDRLKKRGALRMLYCLSKLDKMRFIDFKFGLNISCGALSYLLNDLVCQGMIDKDKITSCYFITNSGRKFFDRVKKR